MIASRRTALICAAVCIVTMVLSAPAAGQDGVAASRVSDIVLEANHGGFHVIFYDEAGKARVTSGTIVFSKKIARLKDSPDEHEPMLKKPFGAGDFRKVSIGAGEGAMALPVKLPGVAHGDRIRMEFGNVRKDVVLGYFGRGERR